MKTAEQILLERIAGLERTNIRYFQGDIARGIDQAIQQCIRTKVSKLDESRDYIKMRLMTQVGHSALNYRD